MPEITKQVATKKCSLCGEEKEVNKSNFYKSRETEDGFQPYCKSCKTIYFPTKGSKKAQTKICSRCKKRKNKSEFNGNSARPDGLQTYCKKCSEEYKQSKENKAREKLRRVKKPQITEKYVAAVEEAQKFSTENPLTADDVKKMRPINHGGVYPPRSPDRKKIRDRKKPRTTQLTEKDFYYKGYYLNVYNALSALGVSDSTIARLSGVDYSSDFRMKTESDADMDIEYQKAIAELELRLSHWMLVMAKGYDYEEVKVKSLKSPQTGNWVEVEQTVTKKHHAGDIQALIMYLTNRFPDKWKVSRELLTGKSQTYDESPSKRDRKAIESYASDVLEQDTDKSKGEHSVQDGLARLSGGGDKASEK